MAETLAWAQASLSPSLDSFPNVTRPLQLRADLPPTFEIYGLFGLSIEAVIGGHVVVGDDDADADADADPSVARILTVDADGLIGLEVLPGTVESHPDLLALAS